MEAQQADTKTKQPRLVPMTPRIKSVLHQLAKVRRLATKYVFLYKGRPLKRISRSFATAKKEAKVIDFRFHDTRHCAATNLRPAGVDTTTAMKIVGHESAKMWKRYNAIDESDLTAAAERIGSYLNTQAANTLITPEDSQAAQ